MTKAMKAATTTPTEWIPVSGFLKLGVWGCYQLMLKPQKDKKKARTMKKATMKQSAMKKAAKKPAMKKAMKK